MKIQDFVPHDPEDIRQIRSQTIGSSEIGTVIGVNPYQTPFDLWAEKKGHLPPKPETMDMRVGRKAQKMIVELYEEEVGETTIALFDEPWFHEKRPWQRASLDALVGAGIGGTGRVSGKRVVEAKSVGFRGSHRWGPAGTDDLPPEYLAQVTWQMSVADIDEADVVALIGHELRVYRVRRDRELEAILVEKATEFYERFMVGNEAPPLEGERLSEYVHRKFPANVMPLRQATLEETLAVTLYDNTRRSLRKAEQEREQAAAVVKGFIGDATGIEGPKFRATWKNTKPMTIVEWERVARDMAAKYEVPLDSFRHIVNKNSMVTQQRRLYVRIEGEEEE